MTTEAHTVSKAGQEGGGIWIRGLFMLLFVLIYGVAEAVICIVTVVQFGWVVFAKETNPRLARFGASLSRFVYQIVMYWTFNSEEKPFPFADWPTSDEMEQTA